MIKLDKEAIEEFKQIFYQVYGKKLSDEEAQEHAIAILMYLLSAKESFDIRKLKT